MGWCEMTDIVRSLPRTQEDRLRTVVGRYLAGSANGMSRFASPVSQVAFSTSNEEGGIQLYFSETEPPGMAIGDLLVKPSDIANAESL
jgi:hypothetical protein